MDRSLSEMSKKAFHVPADPLSGDAQGPHTLGGQPPIPSFIVSGLSLVVMSGAIDLHGQSDGGAVEVENVRAKGMLAAELQSSKALIAKMDP